MKNEELVNGVKIRPKWGGTLYIGDDNDYDFFLEWREMLLIMPHIQISTKRYDANEKEVDTMGEKSMHQFRSVRVRLGKIKG